MRGEKKEMKPEVLGRGVDKTLQWLSSELRRDGRLRLSFSPGHKPGVLQSKR